MKKIILATLSLIIFSLGVLTPVYAVDEHDLTEGTFNVKDVLKLPDVDGKKQQPTKYFNDPTQAPIESFVGTMIDYALAIMGSLAIILIIAGGFVFMTSRGDSSQIDKGKEIMKYAIMGLIVAFLSYIIVLFVQSLFTG